MSHHPIGSYSDPWTRQKAAQAQQALARRGAMGQAPAPAPAPSAGPPPPKKPPVGLMVGWAALLLVSAGMFYKVTSGGPIMANSRKKRWIIDILTKSDAKKLKRYWEGSTGRSHRVVRSPTNRRYWALVREG